MWEEHRCQQHIQGHRPSVVSESSSLTWQNHILCVQQQREYLSFLLGASVVY